MIRHLVLRNALSAAGQTLVQAAVLFLVYRYLIDRLGIERLGVWSVVLATTSALRVSELGLAGSVTKFVATYRSQGNERAASEAVQTAALTVAALLAIVLVLLYPLLAWLLPYVLPGAAAADGLAILGYALLSMWLAAVSSVWLAGLDGCLRSDLRAALVVLATFAFLAMVLGSVPRYGLIGLAASQVAQGVLLTVLGWTTIRRVIRPMPALPMHWRGSRLREMMGYGANVQVMAIVMLLFEPTTKVLLARYGGLVATGHFELAQQLIMRVRALLVETNRVMVPVLAGLEGTGGDPRRFYSRHVRFLFFLLTPAFACLIALAPSISELWIGNYQPQFVVMTIALTIAWYINGLTAPTYFAYLGHGKLRWLTASHVILGVSNALLGLALGPAFGWQGVIAAFVVSLVGGSLLPVYTYHRHNHLTLKSLVWRNDLVLAGVCLATAFIAVAAYLTALRADSVLGTRIALAGTAAAVLLIAASVHPLAREVLLMMRGAASRGAEGRL